MRVLLEEYRICRREIHDQFTWQVQALVMQTGLTAALVGCVATFYESGFWMRSYAGLLLAVPVVSFVLGMFLVDKDEVLMDLMFYQEEVLRPRLTDICGAGVLLYHEHKRGRRWSPERPFGRKVAKWLTSVYPHFYVVVPGALSLAFLLYLPNQSGYAPLVPSHRLFLMVDFVLVGILVLSASLAAVEHLNLGRGGSRQTARSPRRRRSVRAVAPERKRTSVS